MAILEAEVVRVFLLVMVRFSGLLVAAPVLGSGNFPARAKIGFAVFLALVVTPVLPAQPETVPVAPMELGLYAVGELAIGLMLGFVMTIVFAAIQVGGQVMDMQTGFGMMNVFNPALETQFPIFGFYFFILAALYLLVTNGHHLMIRALVRTFDTVPLGGFVVHPRLLIEVSNWAGSMFVDGLMVAAPVAGAMLLAYITLGLLSRVVPQIHLFVVGFPVTIATGLFIVALSTAAYLNVLNGMFRRMFENVDTVIRAMG